MDSKVGSDHHRPSGVLSWPGLCLISPSPIGPLGQWACVNHRHILARQIPGGSGFGKGKKLPPEDRGEPPGAREEGHRWGRRIFEKQNHNVC